jgi:hypothetical protein
MMKSMAPGKVFLKLGTKVREVIIPLYDPDVRPDGSGGATTKSTAAMAATSTFLLPPKSTPTSTYFPPPNSTSRTAASSSSLVNDSHLHPSFQSWFPDYRILPRLPIQSGAIGADASMSSVLVSFPQLPDVSDPGVLIQLERRHLNLRPQAVRAFQIVPVGQHLRLFLRRPRTLRQHFYPRMNWNVPWLVHPKHPPRTAPQRSSLIFDCLINAPLRRIDCSNFSQIMSPLLTARGSSVCP